MQIVTALRRLKRATANLIYLATLAVKSLWEGKEAPLAYLERLGLDDTTSFKTMSVRRSSAGNL